MVPLPTLLSMTALISHAAAWLLNPAPFETIQLAQGLLVQIPFNDALELWPFQIFVAWRLRVWLGNLEAFSGRREQADVHHLLPACLTGCEF